MIWAASMDVICCLLSCLKANFFSPIDIIILFNLTSYCLIFSVFVFLYSDLYIQTYVEFLSNLDLLRFQTKFLASIQGLA